MTTMIKADEQVLKTDELGRVRMSAAQRESLIQEFENVMKRCHEKVSVPAIVEFLR